MHDVLDLRDLVLDEWHQLQSAGRDVDALEAPVRDAVAAHDVEGLRALREELRIAPPRGSWPYVEPQRAVDIGAHLEASRSPDRWRGSTQDLGDRLQGAWLARCVGCVMGKPVEGLDRGTIERYLRAAGHWPQTGYVPRLDPRGRLGERGLALGGVEGGEARGDVGRRGLHRDAQLQGRP